MLSWDDELAQSGTSLRWQVCRSVDWQHVHKKNPLANQHELGRLTQGRLVMIKMWPPFGPQTELVFKDTELRRKVVHQKPQPLSAQCCRPDTHGIRPTTSMGTEQGLLPCAMVDRQCPVCSAWQVYYQIPTVHTTTWLSFPHYLLGRRDHTIST